MPVKEENWLPQEFKRANSWEKAAWFISAVFHPLIIPTYMFGLVLWVSPQVALSGNTAIAWPLWSLLLLATFVLPVLSLLSMFWFGQLQSLHMHELHERRQPFIWVSILYAILTGFFTYRFPQLPVINMMLIGVTLVIMVVTTVSRSWKISAHAAGLGGAVGGLSGLMLFFVAPLLLSVVVLFLVISGIVMWARLYLNHHTPKQVWVGWFAGFAICLAIAAFFERIINYLPVEQ